MSKTLFEKLWDRHVVAELDDGSVLLYIDRHLIHEVTSPQAFDGLRLAGRKARRPDLSFATMDHNVPTDEGRLHIKDPVSKAQVDALVNNCEEFGVNLFGIGHDYQGIVHVIGPQLGITVPGLTVVCGDSHTSTHGAFGCLAFGIGTSEVEHVLATQTLRQRRPKTFNAEFTGKLQDGVTSKDMILKLIGVIGTAGGTGYAMEYTGEAVRALSMEARMTMCNMSIEGGARAGMISPDQTTIDYVSLEDRPYAPKGAHLEECIEMWRSLATDPGAKFDRTVTIDASDIAPQVSWGTSPGMVIDVDKPIPAPGSVSHISETDALNACEYMGIEPGTRMTDVEIDTVFIGSCTNSRIEDLREAARIMEGRTKANSVKLLIVPGSQEVRKQAEAEGLDKVFKAAGAEWRWSGCSMCLAMNPDKLAPKERCASTSNRNFEGRQGKGGRTHLVSPTMAAAAAIEGRFVDIRNWS